MSVSVARIDGFFCQIVSITEAGLVRVVSDTRELRSTAGRRPGADWRPDGSGDPRRWVKREPIYSEIAVQPSDLFEEWPIGLVANGFTADALDEAVAPAMDRAMRAGGFAATRSRPDLRIEAVRSTIMSEGLPIPTPEELDASFERVWAGKIPAGDKGKGARANGRTIIPARDTTLREASIANKWPPQMLNGATEGERGFSGFHLGYTSKVVYDPNRHGKPPEPPPEPVVSTAKAAVEEAPVKTSKSSGKASSKSSGKGAKSS